MVCLDDGILINWGFALAGEGACGMGWDGMGLHMDMGYVYLWVGGGDLGRYGLYKYIPYSNYTIFPLSDMSSFL